MHEGIQDQSHRAVHKAATAGVAPKKVAPARSVNHWFGISADEVYRMRVSPNRWQVNYYPLIETAVCLKNDELFAAASTARLLDWMQAHGFPEPRVRRAQVARIPFRRRVDTNGATPPRRAGLTPWHSTARSGPRTRPCKRMACTSVGRPTRRPAVPSSDVRAAGSGCLQGRRQGGKHHLWDSPGLHRHVWRVKESAMLKLTRRVGESIVLTLPDGRTVTVTVDCELAGCSAARRAFGSA